jgi:hypothetical protein
MSCLPSGIQDSFASSRIPFSCVLDACDSVVVAHEEIIKAFLNALCNVINNFASRAVR